MSQWVDQERIAASFLYSLLLMLLYCDWYWLLGSIITIHLWRAHCPISALENSRPPPEPASLNLSCLLAGRTRMTQSRLWFFAGIHLFCLITCFSNEVIKSKKFVIVVIGYTKREEANNYHFYTTTNDFEFVSSVIMMAIIVKLMMSRLIREIINTFVIKRNTDAEIDIKILTVVQSEFFLLLTYKLNKMHREINIFIYL